MRIENASFISSDVIRRFQVFGQVHVRSFKIMYQNGTRGLFLFASTNPLILAFCSICSDGDC